MKTSQRGFRGGGIRSGPTWRLLPFVSLCCWWGGLSFYSMIVIPLGLTTLRGPELGILTYRSAQIFNLGGIIVVGFLLDDILRFPTRLKWTAWSVFVTCQATLFLLHTWCRQSSGVELGGPFDAFVPPNSTYAYVAGLQWAAGLCLLGLLTKTMRGGIPSHERPDMLGCST